MIINKTNYSINSESKYITIKTDKPLPETDREEIKLYLESGYVLRRKDQDKAKASSQRARKETKEEIETALSDRPEELKEFRRLCKEESFFSARAYYYNHNTKENI